MRLLLHRGNARARGFAWAITLFLAVLAGEPSSAATYTVTADRDTWINEASVNQNNGTTTTLRVSASASNTNRRRSVIGFTLPSIPSNETITAVTLKLYVTTTATQTVTVHRITSAWTETAATWSNLSAAFNGAAEASFAPSSAGSISINVTALVQGWKAGTFANNGLGLIGAASSGAIFSSRQATTAANRPQLVITTARIVPTFTMVKSDAVFSDPLNGATNPKAIPGAAIRYTISLTNSSPGTADSDSTVILEAVPSTMKLFVGDVGVSGSGPVAFTDGSTSSGLSYSFVSLASAADNLSFSNNGGATFTYTPVPDANGCDAAVTHIRINPSGAFAGKTGATSPSASVQLRMQVK